MLTSSPMTAKRVRSFSLVAMSQCLQWSPLLSATTSPLLALRSPDGTYITRKGRRQEGSRDVDALPALTERLAAPQRFSTSPQRSGLSAQYSALSTQYSVCTPTISSSMSISTVSDIFNRPPAISDDMLQYALYPRVGLSDRASVTALAALMRSYVDSLLPGHLWHRDSFELKVAKDEDQEGWILKGRMRVGDCVDDEWCAVWLLREISAKWDVVIRWVLYIGSLILIPHVPIVYLISMANFYSLKRLKPCRRGSPLRMPRTGYGSFQILLQAD